PVGVLRVADVCVMYQPPLLGVVLLFGGDVALLSGHAELSRDPRVHLAGLVAQVAAGLAVQGDVVMARSHTASVRRCRGGGCGGRGGRGAGPDAGPAPQAGTLEEDSPRGR